MKNINVIFCGRKPRHNMMPHQVCRFSTKLATIQLKASVYISHIKCKAKNTFKHDVQYIYYEACYEKLNIFKTVQ